MGLGEGERGERLEKGGEFKRGGGDEDEWLRLKGEWRRRGGRVCGCRANGLGLQCDFFLIGFELYADSDSDWVSKSADYVIARRV